MMGKEMNIYRYAGFALTAVSGALAANQNREKSIQVAPGLIETGKGIPGVGLPVANSVMLGDGQTAKLPHTLRNGLTKLAAGEGNVVELSPTIMAALGLFNASHSHIHVQVNDQSETLTPESIKKALAKEVKEGKFKDARLGHEDVKRLQFLFDQEPQAVQGGVAFEFSSVKDKYIWKPGTIMAVDKQKFDQECHVDLSNGRVSLRTKVIGSDQQQVNSKPRRSPGR